MAEARRLLVTGGAGFVGANLVRRLLAAGHTVRVYDNFVAGDPAYLEGLGSETVEGDIRDSVSLAAALDRVHAVVHLAAAGSVVGSVKDPVGNFDVNVTGTFRVLDACRRARVERVVLASTGGALFGEAVPPVDESMVPSPISPYGASKLAGEGYALAFARSYGLHTVTLRFANVYGPWSAHKQGVTTTFFRALASGSPIVIYGDGSSSRDYIHVDDLTRALQLALEGTVGAGTVIHVASGIETTAAALARICCQIAGSPDHPVVYRPRRPGEVERNVASFGRARELLGFEPAIALDDGLRHTYEWLRALPNWPRGA